MLEHPYQQPATSLQPDECPGKSLVILDTDIGYDPDDFVALALAARTVPDLAVVTADETLGRRARLARRALDALDRPEVPVITGVDFGGSHRFVMEDHPCRPPAGRDERGDAVTGLIDAVAGVCESTTGPIFWVGMGPMTNLALIVSSLPDLADRLIVTQMGGWLDHYRDTTRATHNLHTDTSSAGLALRAVQNPRLVLSDFTNSPHIDVTAESALLRHLRSETATEWQQLLAANFRAWFARRSGSWMHDPLTLSAALDLAFVSFRPERIRIARDARLYRDPHGRPIDVACAVDYPEFLEWMHETLLR
ncbi:nucleoside hydrolase [Nocardia sp. CS682]|uniref:nucleoside hydrolase n=1 Tax=Nocardia sp. CS682 TaxID=1047172 RepID=UPI001074BF92|nr:nucleoside hydrolase [Nocardia sp. CS682]QBS41328.1 nucleoside hydrolase [Nocardia sp. CS682]